MKRWLVILLIAAALLLILSPGIIGRLAERGIDSSLTQVSIESEDVDIAKESFERGWFSSAGRHRVALRGGSLRELIVASYPADAPADEPALIIDTRLDHGLIPISSVRRDGGSLNPALANAVSTLEVDPGNGTLTPLPGKLYSFFGVGGNTSFRYLLNAGEEQIAAAVLRWSTVDLSFELSADGLGQTITAEIDALNADSPAVAAALDSLAFKWTYDDRPDTLGDGTLDIQIRDLAVTPGSGTDAASVPTGAVSVERFDLNGASRVRNDHLQAEGQFDLAVRDAEMFGDAQLGMEMQLQAVDARALDALLTTYRELDATDNADPLAMYSNPTLQRLLESLIVGGGRLKIMNAVFRVDPGEARLNLTLDVNETQGEDRFSWPTVLLNSRGAVDARIAASLYDAMVQIDPHVRGALASGMLMKDGDQYVMNIEFDKGRLTINGAPMSLPIGSAMGLPR